MKPKLTIILTIKLLYTIDGNVVTLHILKKKKAIEMPVLQIRDR